MTKVEWLRHVRPVWEDRADSVVHADVVPFLESAGDRLVYEQLWARCVGDAEFEVCCIPFFIYGVALGDIVRAVPSGGHPFLMERVLVPSGRRVFRVWFGGSEYPKDGVVAELGERGALVEWSSPNLLGVCVENEEHGDLIAGFLGWHAEKGHFEFERG